MLSLCIFRTRHANGIARPPVKSRHNILPRPYQAVIPTPNWESGAKPHGGGHSPSRISSFGHNKAKGVPTEGQREIRAATTRRKVAQGFPGETRGQVLRDEVPLGHEKLPAHSWNNPVARVQPTAAENPDHPFLSGFTAQPGTHHSQGGRSKRKGRYIGMDRVI